MSAEPEPGGFAGLLSGAIGSPLPALLMAAAVLVGLAALWLTPREEEPQIVVPIADVYITAPGLSAAQVERQVTTPLERLLYEIDGVEHVYSMSQPGRSVVTVRFYVGQDREDSLVKIYNKLYANTDQVPAAVQSWVVKPVEVDDVPIVVAALWSDDPARADDHALRRLAEELARQLQPIKHANRVEVVGGRPRRVRVELDPEALAARRTAPLDIAWALGVSNQQLPAGELVRRDQSVRVDAGGFIGDAAALRRLVINVVDGVPVYLDDVATVRDGPAEPTDYTWLGLGPAADASGGAIYPSVFLAVAKTKGSNAVWVAAEVEQRLAELARTLFPPQVHYHIIRNYGDTADQKVNDLVASLLVAVLTVVIFIGLFLGWRAAVIVGLAVPVCYGATLGLDLLGGYTINRVTLFALILALGLLVDDPIAGVDNIERYRRAGRYPPRRATVLAMLEIRGALIMSTVAIILAFTPMFFITGMMGPYMAPMAFNIPVSVTVSTLVAFFITPWLAARLLRAGGSVASAGDVPTARYRVYAALLAPLLARPRRAWLLLAAVGALFVAALVLPALRLVPLKLLPFDNKNEFQVVIDMPEGTTLERTQAVAYALTDYLLRVPEVEAVAAFVGLPSPMDFNGMVRHDYLRQGPQVADLRVTLAARERRAQQSHAIVLRLRQALAAIAQQRGASIKLVEVPPGPPVIATVTAELYAPPTAPYTTLEQAARRLAERLAREPGVVDIDTSVEADQRRLLFVTDQEKAALSGVAVEDVARTLELANAGLIAGFLQIPTEARPLAVELRLPLTRRAAASDLAALTLKGRPGIAKLRDRSGVRDAPQPLLQLGELGAFEPGLVDKTIYHKNLQRVAYVFAETAGRPPADVVLDVAADRATAGETNADTAFRSPAERSYLRLGGGDPGGCRRGCARCGTARASGILPCGCFATWGWRSPRR